MRLRPVARLKAGAFAVLVALSAVLPAAHAAELTAPPRVLRDDVLPGTGRAQHLGHLPHRAYLRLAFTLAARDRADLDTYVAEVDDPDSPRYRQYLRGSQFAARYGRTVAEIERLRAYLEGNGFHIDDVHSGRLVVDASASAADVERTLGIRLDTWRDPASGRVFYGNATPPELPADPGYLVADIAGLTDRAVRRPTVSFGGADGLTPAQLRDAQGSVSNTRGDRSGPRPRVALAEFAGFRPQDVAAYDRRFALASPAPELRLVDGGPVDGDAGRAAVEAEIETVQAVAPDTATVVFSAENSAAGEVDAWQSVIDAGIPVAMTGWGAPEEQRTGSGMRAIDLVLEEGAAEGVGFYAPADHGSEASDDSGGGVLFPASDPHVTAVGAADDAATGGTESGRGRSAVFAQPWWQARWVGVDPYGRREVPDVTARVVRGPVVHADGRWRTAGGTGVATALWTALAAGYDQRAASLQQPRLGFAPPTLYRFTLGRGAVAGVLQAGGWVPFDGARAAAPSRPNRLHG
ncbi:S53 family peptidase [Streptacidiphilus pinicola]|uniref:S53 family peptidase n=1 Tax=Streptacidiphilus pinicola TaxID=2219663 RepID=UPI001401E7F8|nr:protease pro-enzyme activation domain-containing protein [Streptacidiphilus pinicola]